jgi:hypothetical protein
MMDCYEVGHFEEILKLYLDDPEFSNHPIIKICLDLYSYLEILSKESNFIANTITNYRRRISSFYKEDVDKDDYLETEDSQNTINKLPEEEIFFAFLLKISKKIEITVEDSFGNKMNKKIYFPLRPETYYLEMKTKERVKQEVDLDRRREDFQAMFKAFFKEMDKNYQFKLKDSLMYFLSKNDTFSYQKILCWFIGFIINIMVLLTYKLDQNDDLERRRLSISSQKSLIRLISYIFCCYSGILFLLWLFFRSSTQRQLKALKFRRENPNEDLTTFANKFKISVILTFFGDSSAQSFLFHALLSILGNLVNPVFYTFHLILIINISSTAAYVAKASTAHLGQLCMTLVLAIFFIFSFSILNADFYSGVFDDGVTGNIDVCENMVSCLVYMLNIGLRFGGGIGDAQVLYPYNSGKLLGKTLFDLMFFFVINVISLNIVFGIIIDTFSEIREDANQRSKRAFNC